MHRAQTKQGFLVLLALSLFTAAAAAEDAATSTQGAVVVRQDRPPGAQISFWLESSLNRVFPGSPPGSAQIELLAARNGRIAFQACLRNDRISPLDVECKVIGADDVKPQVRLVGFVPMPHFTTDTDLKELDGIGFLPGLVPDVL